MSGSYLYRTGTRLLFLLVVVVLLSFVGQSSVSAQAPQIAFQQSLLQDIVDLGNPTTLQFGPDGRLYVAERYGTIFALTVQRNGPGDYSVIDQENIETIWQDIPNRQDNGVINDSYEFLQVSRQITGILVKGTAENPIIYVASCDPREGGGSGGTDTDLDTNSGVLSRLTWNGSSWDHLQLVRGLPRSEELHSINAMVIDDATNIMYLAVGGNTNMGVPSNNFALAAEYAYSGAIITIDLNAIGETTYDMPTLDDPTRPNNPDGSDINDPFGGNDGLNQARIVPGGPVQLYATGFRNPYDIVVTEQGRMYTVDNGPNYGWGGPPVNQNPGQCDNTVNEADSFTYEDGLEFITGFGFYGGHPAPVRANPQGLYANEADSPVPFSMANPIECDYQIPGVEDNSLATWPASTNGLAVYNATNFDGAMQGDLLTVSYDGNVYRMKPTASGDALVDLTPGTSDDWGDQALFSGFGIVPLDVIAQPDDEIFPGTIWVANLVSESIAVFEPSDTPCFGEYDFILDEDGDGFKNSDEIDNGTNPCSNGSKPNDNDGDKISDLNDNDDDNDGILDVDDYFAIDPTNGTETFLPLHYEMFQSDPGTGFFGVGFTGLMINHATDYLNQFDIAQLTVGGAAGKATVDNLTRGTAFGATNTQDYAFQWGVNVTQALGRFEIYAQLNAPFFTPTPEAGDEVGVYFGNGDQDNYFELALAADDTTGAVGFEVIFENAGVPNRTFYPVPGANNSLNIHVSMIIDPVAGTVQPRYDLDGAGWNNLGTPVTVSGTVLNVLQTSQVMAVGLIGHSGAGSATTFGGTWDNVFIEPAQPGVLAVNPSPVAFGNVEENTFAQKVVKIQNYGQTGDQTINISNISIAGNPDFTIVNNPGTATILPGGSMNLTIRYQPSAVELDNATLQITHDGANNPLSVNISGNGTIHYDPIYRVNVGGPQLADPQGFLPWSADNNLSPSQYANHAVTGSTVVTTGATINTSSPTLPVYTPPLLFNTARFDYDGGAEMTYNFPVPSGTYVVRLYLAEIFTGAAFANARIFDVSAEGVVPPAFNNIDRYVKGGGANRGFMISSEVIVNDGNLTLSFLHDVENPEIQGIEISPVIYDANAIVSSSSPSIDFGEIAVGVDSSQVITLTNTGAPNALPVTINSISYSGANAADFSDDLTNPVVLGVGETVDITVTANAAAVGNKTAVLRVNHSGFNIPMDINLTATAYQSGALQITPNPITYGLVEMNNPSTIPVTLTNLGSPTDPAISVSSLTVTGPNASLFQFEPFSSPIVIPGAGSVVLDLTIDSDTVGLFSATVSATHNGNNSPVTVPITAQGIEELAPLYRVNSGGPLVVDPNGEMNWGEDSLANPSPYLVDGSQSFYVTTNPIDMSSPTLPAGTPQQIFQTERWDMNTGAASDGEMTYGFPVVNGTYVVNLYVGEIFDGITQPGQRIFDVSINGAIPTVFDDIDAFALAGYESGYVLSTYVEVTNNNLNVVFHHGVENPSIKAVEVLGVPFPIPAVAPVPVNYDFGSVLVGSNASQPITLTNTGSIGAPSLTISNVSFGNPAYTSNFAGPVVLAPGASTVVIVNFAPTVGGAANTNMTVSHNGTNPPTLVPLSGFGSLANILSEDVSTLNFGNIVVGASGTRSVTLTNGGTASDPAITITGLNIGGINAADFSHGESFPIVIAGGESRVVDVTFTPTATGARSAQMTIVNDGTQGNLLLNLRGSSNNPIYRVNVGGPALTDPAGILNWSQDDATLASPYLAAGGENFYSTTEAIDMSSASLPDNTPAALFQTERWDVGDGLATELTYAFPVTNGTYAVNVYVSEIFDGITAAGQRVFDVNVEGAVPSSFVGVDPFGLSGLYGGYMVTAEVEVVDGVLDVAFIHDIENTSIKGIEIAPISAVPIPSIEFGADVSFDLQEGQALIPGGTTSTATSDLTTPTINLTAVDNATSNTPVWLSIPSSIVAGDVLVVDVDVIGLAPGTYTATVTGASNAYVSDSFLVTVTVNDISINVSAPTVSQNIIGDTVTVTWTSTTNLADDHIHVTLDDLSTGAVEPPVGSLPQNSTLDFTSVAPGNYNVIVVMANVNHVEYQGTEVVIPITVSATGGSSTASALVRVESGGDIVSSSTYSPSFYVENTSTGGESIVSVSWDISTAIVPDIAYDPDGTAGDDVGLCLTPAAGAVATGFIAGDLCVDPFSVPIGLGYSMLTTNFTDFGVGESFLFGVDIDPISTEGTAQGQAPLNDSASVSGYELLGSVVTIEFSDGTTLSTQLWRLGTSVTGSVNNAVDNPLAVPSISVVGVPTTPAIVNNLSQIVQVTGPVGAEVSLLVNEGDMFEQDGGGIDVDPFELNTVLNVGEYTATIGAGGTVDIPISLLTDSYPACTICDLNYIVAVIREGNQTSNLSNRIILQFNGTNQAPILTNPGGQTNTEGDVVSLQVVASDPETQPLTFSATGLPTGLSIEPTTGLISGTISAGAAAGSPYSTVITVTDGNTPMNANLTWTVNAPTNLPPDVTNPGTQTSVESDIVSLQIVATDPETQALSYGATGLPTGLSISPTTGLISGTISAGAAAGSPYSVTVTVTDGVNPVPVNFTWTVGATAGNLPPNVTNPGTQTSSEGAVISLQIAATDPETQPLSYGATGLPTGLSISPTTGLISGTISAGAAAGSPYSVTVTVTDGVNPVPVNFTWTVSAGTNLPPVVTNPGARSNAEGNIVSVQVAATDPEAQPLSYGATGLPTGLSISPTTGLISGTISAGAATGSPYSVTVTVTDGANPVPVNFTWTVTATPTVIQVTSLQLMDVSDNSAGPILTNGMVINLNDYPAGLNVRANTSGAVGQIQFWVNGVNVRTESTAPYALAGDAAGVFAPWAVGAGTYVINAIPTANDPAGALQVTITLSTGAPIVTNPGAQTSTEGDVVSLQIAATDPESQPISYGATGLPTGLSINPTTGLISGTVSAGAAAGSPYNVAVTVTDGTNPTVVNFTWTVGATVGNLPPNVTNPGAQTHVEGSVISLQIQATDPEAQPLAYNVTNLPPGLTFSTTTGLISGTISAGAATGSPYTVGVTVADAVNPVNINFTWTVTATATAAQVTSLQLIDVATNTPGPILTEGMYINLNDYPSGISVNANTAGTIGSIQFLVNGADFRTESGAPYAIAGDAAGVFAPWAVGAGTYTVSAIPSGNLSGAVTVTITLGTGAANLPPVVTNPGSRMNTQGNSVSLQINATDPESQALNYSATGLPTGLSINPTTGLISGTIATGAAASSPYSVTVTVSDGVFAVPVNFTWLVGATGNLPPNVTNPGPQSNVIGNVISLQIVATDPEGQILRYSATGLPTGLSINTNNGRITGTIAAGAAAGSPYNVNVRVTDGTNIVNVSFVWTITSVANLAPNVTNPGARSNSVGNAVSLQIVATDPESQPLNYSAIGLPTGLSINPTTGLISGTIGAGATASSPYSVTVTVSDGVFSVPVNFTWTITAIVGPQVTALQLIDVATNTSALNLTNGAVISLASYPSGININAVTSGTIASIQFSVNGVDVRTEANAPYALAGDAAGVFAAWAITPGTYTVVATPTTNAPGAMTITFTITA